MLAVDKSDVQVAVWKQGAWRLSASACKILVLSFIIQNSSVRVLSSSFFVSYWDIVIVISLLYSSTVWPQLRA